MGSGQKGVGWSRERGCVSRLRSELSGARRWRRSASWAGGERVQAGQSDRLPQRRDHSSVKLPRDHAVAGLRLWMAVWMTADTRPVPRVNRLKLELGWRGELADTWPPGLPTGSSLKGITTRARRSNSCGGVAGGTRKAVSPRSSSRTRPVQGSARIARFNGRTEVGRPVVLVHAYTIQPAGGLSSSPSCPPPGCDFHTVFALDPEAIGRSPGPMSRTFKFDVCTQLHTQASGAAT